MASKTVNPNGLAIVETLLAHKGETRAYAEITSEANIKNQTGYLTAARAIAKDRHLKIEKVKDAVNVTVKTITTFPNGLAVESEKPDTVDGYRIVDGE